MCTVSWVRQGDGYVLFCNRDERHTRKPASGPRVSLQRGVSFIAPVDGDHGGSWIGVNESGLTLCLLNRYGDEQVHANYTSRGLLLTELLDCSRGGAVRTRVEATKLGKFQPFTLAVLTLDEPALQIDWTGTDCLVQLDAEAQMPLVSTSLREPSISEQRKAHLRSMVAAAGSLDAALLDQFHRSHAPERGPYSVCMHREEAATVSLSIVTVTREQVEFAYHAGTPCVAGLCQRVELRSGSLDRLQLSLSS